MMDLRVIFRAAAGITALVSLLTVTACEGITGESEPVVISVPSSAESSLLPSAPAAVKQQSKQESSSAASVKDEKQSSAFRNLSYWTKTDNGIKITAKASVTDKTMQYAFFFRRTTNKTWKTIGTPYATKSTASMTLQDGVKYQVKVNIKNQSGQVESALFEVDNTIPLLENKTKIKSSVIEMGSSLKMTAKANGGVEPYTYAFYFRRASNQRWNKLGTEFDTRNSAKFKPASADRYQLRIIVKDHSGQAAVKDAEMTVI